MHSERHDASLDRAGLVPNCAAGFYGVDRIRFTQYGFVAMDVEPDWGLQPTGWRVRIHGDAPFDVSMPFPVPLDDLANFVPAFNANGPVNAIPYVCAAPAGLLTTADLPHILPRGPRR